jgi:hypothetical protein
MHRAHNNEIDISPLYKSRDCFASQNKAYVTALRTRLKIEQHRTLAPCSEIRKFIRPRTFRLNTSYHRIQQGSLVVYKGQLVEANHFVLLRCILAFADTTCSQLPYFCSLSSPLVSLVQARQLLLGALGQFSHIARIVIMRL